jgi:hypothetical protein
MGFGVAEGCLLCVCHAPSTGIMGPLFAVTNTGSLITGLTYFITYIIIVKV